MLAAAAVASSPPTLVAGLPNALADFGFAALSIVVLAAAILGGLAAVKAYRKKDADERELNLTKANAAWKERCEAQDREIADLRHEIKVLRAEHEQVKAENSRLVDMVQGVSELKALREELGGLGRALLAKHDETISAIKGVSR